MSESNMMTKREAPKNVAMALQVPSISKRIEDMLGKRAPQFCSALIQVSKASHLAGCDPMTIIGGAMTAASMDLSIDPNLGFAHIVPYNSKDGKQAQFQMGYKGFIQLGLRTGQYAAMNDFRVNREAFISFNPVTGDLKLDSDKLNEDGDIVGYGFYFRLVNGFEKTVYWPKEKIERHAKQFSKAYAKGYGPWKDMFDAMALKTVIKLTLGKYGILSTEMQTAVTRDQSVISDDGETQMVYVDNDAQVSGPKYESPDFEGKPSAPHPTLDESNDDLNGDPTPNRDAPDIAVMKKSELIKEVTSYGDDPRYDELVLDVIPEGCTVSQCSSEMLRDMVRALRIK